MHAIPTESVDCPPLTAGLLNADWDDLVWAAITVGRPNRYYVLKHGISSIYEIIFRASLLRMALASSVGGRRFVRTRTFATLDPSEKGAVNYFLGLTLCKLYAELHLGTSWLLHLDVFRDLNPVLRTTERSRPDLVGWAPNDTWISFESKGRVAAPDKATKAKAKAKDQARRVISVLGRPVTGHYAGISFFNNETLNFFVQDPPPFDEGDAKALKLKGDSAHLFRTYYEPFVTLIQADKLGSSKTQEFVGLGSRPEMESSYSEEMDLEIGMRTDLFEMGAKEQWAEIAQTCSRDRSRILASGFHADGLWIRCGNAWRERIKRSQNREVSDE